MGHMDGWKEGVYIASECLLIPMACFFLPVYWASEVNRWRIYCMTYSRSPRLTITP